MKGGTQLEREDLINLPQQLAEKYGTGAATILDNPLSFPHQALEIHQEEKIIGFISWGSGDV